MFFVDFESLTRNCRDFKSLVTLIYSKVFYCQGEIFLNLSQIGVKKFTKCFFDLNGEISGGIGEIGDYLAYLLSWEGNPQQRSFLLMIVARLSFGIPDHYFVVWYLNLIT